MLRLVSKGTELPVQQEALIKLDYITAERQEE